ncbi:M48 family metalloprotease [Pseudomonas sp. C2B4]|uniref:M48 family metalloprotease n=1 Tax=Pseudomonas sp. C2B4 TaxID=2735270 RepID=UPI001585EB6A|nr:M48 family metalloprotease [Pseudomonas sp. C2B4]NUU39292.1 M48 family metalloprotease [Pseudomonas sp. C2B4]
MNARVALYGVLALAILVSACSTPKLSNPFSSKEGPQNIKDIGSLPPRALVVLDRNCAELVQPYRLTDNFASLSVFGIQEGIKAVPGQLSKLLGGGDSQAAASSDKLGDSAKQAAKQLNWLPMSAEVMYAERQHQSRQEELLARDSKQGRKYYPTADKMLSDILASIHEPYDYRFKLFIVKSDNHNALALPGGYLYLDKGLLTTPQMQKKAYFALAHEISHVLQRHETKEMQSVVVDSFSVKSDLLTVMKGAQGNPKAVVDRVKLEKGQFTQHHVDQELQADSCAVKMLSRVYPDRQQLAEAINAFITDLPATQGGPATKIASNQFLAMADDVEDIVTTPAMRHPNTQERKANLQEIYQEVSAGGK